MDILEKKWENVLGDLINQITAISYDMWVKKLIPLDIINNKLYLQAPNASTKINCVKSFSYLLSQSIQQHFNVDEFEILLPEEYDSFKKNITNDEKVTVRKENPFNQKYTFENFVVGKSNQFVYSAVRSVAENPGSRFNPLFIYGGVGLGKTHLLHSIGNYVVKNNPSLNILYVTCEKFTNDYLETLHSHTSNKVKEISAFREKYRNVDILMVDDIQFISNKKETQEEFFHTFNDLYQNNKHIIISSDRPPKEISTLEERLMSRFSMGLIQDIQTPDFETRYVILQKKAQLENFNITNEALEYIADTIKTNIRELEGILSKTMFLTSLMGKEQATIFEAKEALKDSEHEKSENISPQKIIETVSQFYRIDKSLILGTKRNKEIASARHICIYLISDMLDLPLSTIGRDIFNRDHTTIMHARNKIADNITKNERLKRDINDLKLMIQGK